MIKTNKLQENIYQLTNTTQFVNCGVLHTDDFTIVVDSMLKPTDGMEILNFINNEIKRPVRYIINTHWHTDHVSNNEMLKEPHTVVIGQKKYLKTLQEERSVITPQNETLQEIDFDSPNILFNDDIELIDNINIKLIHLPGHSDDSIGVYLPEQKIVFTGDTVLRWETEEEIIIPYFYWGNSDDLVTSLNKLLTLETEIIVPGHGLKCSRSKIEEQLFYLNTLKQKFDDVYLTNQNLPDEKLKDVVFSSLTLESIFDKSFRRRNWVDRAHEMNLEKLLAEKELSK